MCIEFLKGGVAWHGPRSTEYGFRIMGVKKTPQLTAGAKKTRKYQIPNPFTVLLFSSVKMKEKNLLLITKDNELTEFMN
jgi:hypothetical protein